MDWDEEYELMKAGLHNPAGARRAGPSIANPNQDDISNANNNHRTRHEPRLDRNENVFLDEEIGEVQEEEEEQGGRETPLAQLARHWMNERHAPDILPAKEDLLVNLLNHLRRQSEAVQLLREDPSTSEEEHMRIMLVQTEVERVKFIVRSYVRTRLFKIERYARFITTNPDIQTRLTAAELDHASRHANLTDQHFYRSVLQGLPEKQSHLDDNPLFVPPMITEPDKSRPVFVHALRRCPRIRLPDGATLDMNKGHISLVPYAVVEQLVARGEVELI